MSSKLPAYGWTTHSEQTDAASLEARAWSMRTEMHGGVVVTSLLAPPDPDTIMKLEAISARMGEHARECKSELCSHKAEPLLLMCPGGKFDPKVNVFFTVVLDLSGRTMPSLQDVALNPIDAQKAHYSACTMLVGAVSIWGTTQGRPA